MTKDAHIGPAVKVKRDIRVHQQVHIIGLAFQLILDLLLLGAIGDHGGDDIRIAAA